MQYVKERISSINKFKNIVEVEMNVTNFGLFTQNECKELALNAKKKNII
jgi:hypothetical protein